MNEKMGVAGHVLSIQSHTVAGYVGNKCAIFPLQLLEFDVDPIHSVHFSNHTGYAVVRGQRLLADELRALMDGLMQNQFLSHYTDILTGYIGQIDLIQAVHDSIEQVIASNSNVRYVCDPVLGDNGQLYVPPELVQVYRTRLVPLAHIITPNQFECEMLLENKIQIHTLQDAILACKRLHAIGPRHVVITSIELPNHDPSQLFVIASEYSNTQSKPYQHHWFEIPKHAGYFTGTGDLFAALLLAWTKKLTVFRDAVQHALGTMRCVLDRTACGGATTASRSSRSSPSSRSSARRTRPDLRLIESRMDILVPRLLPEIHTLKIHGVIFDLDGTLTVPHLLDFSTIRARYNFPPTQDLLHAVSALPPDDQEHAHAMLKHEEARAADMMLLQPRVAQLLQGLIARRIKLAIATRNTPSSVHAFCRQAGIAQSVFDSIMTREDDAVKPDPNVAWTIAEAINVAPRHILFVGDSTDDIACGRQAGCRTALVLNARNQALRSSAEISVTALDQVLDYINAYS